MAAFTAAVAQGADGIELDTMVCASGEVVVCHDETLERLAGIPDRVDQLPLEKIRTLDVGSRFSPSFAGERIPLLADVLASLPTGTFVDIELKAEQANDHGLARKVASIVAADAERHPVLISSFSPLELVRMRAFARTAKTGLIFEPDGPLWLRHGSLATIVANASVNPQHTQCTQASVRRWHERGFAVFTWTVDDPIEIQRLCQASVDAIITNRPRTTLDGVNLSSRGRASPRP